MDAIGIFIARLFGTVAGSAADAAQGLAPVFLASLIPVAIAAWRGRGSGTALALVLVADMLFLFDAAYGSALWLATLALALLPRRTAQASKPAAPVSAEV